MGEQGQSGPRATRVVLENALHELQERISRLERVEAELAEAKVAVKALQKLLPSSVAADTARRASRVPREATAERLAEIAAIDETVLGVIRRVGLVGSATIMTETDLDSGAVKASLGRLRESGAVSMVGTRGMARYRLAGDSPVRLVADTAESAA